MEVAGANRRWRCQFRCRGSRRESAVAQLFSLGRFMRVTLLTFFFALSAFCATADQIDNLVTNLPDGWDGGQTPMVNLPETSSVEQVLRGVFKVWWFDDSHVTNFTVLKSRQVTI